RTPSESNASMWAVVAAAVLKKKQLKLLAGPSGNVIVCVPGAISSAVVPRRTGVAEDAGGHIPLLKLIKLGLVMLSTGVGSSRHAAWFSNVRICSPPGVS